MRPSVSCYRLPAADGTHNLSLQPCDWTVALLMAGESRTLHLLDLGTSLRGQLGFVTRLRYLYVYHSNGFDSCVKLPMNSKLRLYLVLLPGLL